MAVLEGGDECSLQNHKGDILEQEPELLDGVVEVVGVEGIGIVVHHLD